MEPVEYESGISTSIDGYETEVIPAIKVIGIGGGGSNAVEYMAKDGGVDGAEFYVINTDAQALHRSTVLHSVQIGLEATKGLGAGANPEVGRQAAEDDKEAIKNMLTGADMVFIATGMGGGTGTGAAPVIAKIAKSLGILTVAVITKPFNFEGKKRMRVAEQGLAELVNCVDSLIVIPNEKLIQILPKNIGLLDAFAEANDVLRNAVRGVSDIITSHGNINVDFSDVRTVMSEMGYAMMGIGIASGEPGDGRAEKAASMAINSPLLEDIDLSNGARGVLVNITAGENINLAEYSAIGDLIQEFASDEAVIVIGTSIDPDLKEEIKVTVVATGIASIDAKKRAVVQPVQQQNPQKLVASGRRDNGNQPKTPTSHREVVKDAIFDIDGYLKNTKVTR